MRHRISPSLTGKSLTITLLLSICLLTACGFQPRGTLTKVPDALKVMYVESSDDYSRFTRQLTRSLEAADVTIVDSPSEAPYRLVILNEDYSRRTVTVTSRAKTAEYELRGDVSFEIRDNANNIIFGPERVNAEKVYLFDQNNVMGKSEEEKLLKREMQRNMIQRIVSRLSTASLPNTQQASANQTEP